ncbi:helix-turn-helix domain-containing protein [Corynebacterium ulceribovis]|uniref:helix-turn-helix domain-containing protein n=1 Tax=Corynebacterium ulceribovis TaxID=487732 RepID=UPI00035D5E63|nr:helix-turn-helix domain-containing protein [Corynebacterium ulceribovis]
MTTSAPAEWLTVAAAAELIQVSQDTIRELINDKKLKATYFSARCLRVNRASIDKLAAKNMV